MNMLTVEGCSKNGPSSQLSKHVFPTQQFRKYLSSDAYLSFRNFLKFHVNFKNAMKIFEKNKFCR